MRDEIKKNQENNKTYKKIKRMKFKSNKIK